MASISPAAAAATVVALLCFFSLTRAQNCGCAAGLCCSKFGFCGTTDVYCGGGCQSGPCTGSPTPATPVTRSGGAGDIVTADFFNGLMDGLAGTCEGKNFYTYDAFINAADSFSGFGTFGATDVQKKELAAFFANVMHETGSLCFINEQKPGMGYCQATDKWPCAVGKEYHGRGPIQLSWNYNYGPAGKDIGFDGINNPDVVAEDAAISFKTAVWFWMKNSNCHTAITSGEGFGATIKAINSMECNGGYPELVQKRVTFYRKFCSQLGVDPGTNVSC